MFGNHLVLLWFLKTLGNKSSSNWGEAVAGAIRSPRPQRTGAQRIGFRELPGIHGDSLGFVMALMGVHGSSWRLMVGLMAIFNGDFSQTYMEKHA